MLADPNLERDYEARCSAVEGLGPIVDRLIQELLRAESIRPHSVAHRIKSKDSLQRKLGRKGASYSGLDDVHDLLGVRVITFFPDEVDLVAGVIEAEFRIDAENSVDKRALLDPDRFGYLSRHYVATLNSARGGLTEHTRFKDVCFEIQIRSILQHAWAEIEHDLGYHSAGAIPDSVRRRFSRLAGLLEIADDEFQTLREEVADYQTEVGNDVDLSPESVPINQDSIAAFVRGSEAVRELDLSIAAAFDVPIVGDPDSMAGSLATRMRWAGLETVAQLGDVLERRSAVIRAFVNWWSLRERQSPRTQAYPGIALFYLAYVLAAEPDDPQHVRAYLDAENIGSSSERPGLVREVLNSYKLALGDLG